MPNKFDTVQYKTNPAGIHANIAVNISGNHFIYFWAFAIGLFGSMGCDLVSKVCKCCCHHIVAPIRIGKMKYGSIAAKSLIHRKSAWRIGTEISNALYSAKNIGICSNMGKQPDTGDDLCDLYNAIISCCMRNLSFAYVF